MNNIIRINLDKSIRQYYNWIYIINNNKERFLNLLRIDKVVTGFKISCYDEKNLVENLDLKYDSISNVNVLKIKSTKIDDIAIIERKFYYKKTFKNKPDIYIKSDFEKMIFDINYNTYTSDNKNQIHCYIFQLSLFICFQKYFLVLNISNLEYLLK